MEHRLLPAFAACLLLLAHAPATAQESALEGLRSAARAAPRDYDAQLALGRAMLEAGRYREAQAQLQRASRLRRGDAAALYEVARVAFEQHEHQRARSQCRAVARAAGQNPIGRVCEARAYLAWNRSARAFEELEAALQQSPGDFEALLALGDAHRLRAAVPEAEDAYRRAIAANGQSAEPHLGLGRLYAQAGRTADALSALRRAHELAPADPDVDYELGRIQSGPAAIEHLREAAQNRPSWALAHEAFGEALLGAGQHDEAATALRRAIELDSHLASARSALGRAMMAAGQMDDAEAAIREALDEVPNDAGAVSALAELFSRTSRVEEAYQQYQHAADLNPRDPAPLLAAAELAIAQQRPVFATAFLQRVLAQNPRNAPALALMGDILRGRRQIAEARQHYQRALAGEGTIDRARIERALRELR